MVHSENNRLILLFRNSFLFNFIKYSDNLNSLCLGHKVYVTSATVKGRGQGINLQLKLQLLCMVLVQCQHYGFCDFVIL